MFCLLDGANHIAVCLAHISITQALVTVTINKFPLAIQDIKTKTELDFSKKGLQVEEAIIIASLIPLNVSDAPVVIDAI